MKHLINGNTIAFSIGLIFILFHLQGIIQKNEQARQVYDIIYSTFNPLGKTTIYLSMIFIGLILSEIKIDSFYDILKRYPLAILSLFKLIVIPVMALVILYFTGGFLSPMVKSVIVLQLAMPCGTIVSALASQYDSDYRFTTEGIFITTIMSIITLPMIVHLIQIFG